MQCATSERRGAPERLTPDPCQVQPSWNAPPPAGTSTGTSSGSTPFAACRLPQLDVRVRRSVELLDHPPAPGPAVRAAHVLDGALRSRRVLEGDPAADPVGGDGPLLVARVLVEAERLPARRLPQHVVLTEASAGPAAQPGTGAPEVRSQHNACDVAVRLPGVADLPGEVRRVHAGAPVPLVGVEPRLEPPGEEVLVAGQSIVGPARGRRGARRRRSRRARTSRPARR